MGKPQSITLRAYAVIVEDGKILLCRLGPDSVDPGIWTLPGGGANFGEPPHVACHREVMEETGHTVEIESAAYVNSQLWDNETDWHQSVRFLYRARITGGTLTNEFEGTTDLATWVDLESVKDLRRADIVDFALQLASGLPEFTR